MPSTPARSSRAVGLLGIALALLGLLGLSGCTGLPEGSAAFGDTVTVRYTALDANGTVVRTERTATFVVGSGGSGLGLAFERGIRGHAPNEDFTVAVDDDPSLRLGEIVEVERALQPIPMHQDAPRADFDATPGVGPAAVGKQFPAYRIYTGVVTSMSATQVNFTINADPMQEDPVPEVGAILVTDPDGTFLQRSLKPDVGATFTIDPPTPSLPQTPLGLDPGSYRTLGGTEDTIQYTFLTSSSADLVGKDLRFRVTILRLTAGASSVEPVCADEERTEDCNYGVRDSPYVNGDPDSVLGAGDGHAHTH